MVAIAGVGLSQSQRLGTPSRYLMWVAGAQALGASYLTFLGTLSKNKIRSAEAGNLTSASADAYVGLLALQVVA